MLRIWKRKRLLVSVAAAGAISITAGALAYFTGQSSTATGSASVGSNSAWVVTVTSTSGTIYPGTGSTTINYSVKNGGSGYQDLSNTTAAMIADGSGNVEQSGVSKSGCLASWFTANNTSPAATDLAAGASTTGNVSVTMSDSGTNQNSCQGVSPDVKVTAN